MYLVYIIISENLYYVGMTNDFFNRLRQHNREICGGAKYTRKKKNWKPICIIDGFNNKSEAMQCEWKLKNKKSLISRKFKGYLGRLEYLNYLLLKEKWTSNSPLIKDQNLNIYIIDKYKKLITNTENNNINIRELFLDN